MKIFCILLLCGFVCCRPNDVRTPTFSWIETSSVDEVPQLQIKFHDNGDEDFAILQLFNPIPLGPTERAADVDGCIFHGFLKHESDVYVTVTGCPDSDSFEVQFKSKRLSRTMFHVAKGTTRIVNVNRNVFPVSDVMFERETANARIDKDVQPLNPNGYISTIKIHYDETWAEKFQGDSVNAARRVMAHAQNVWMYPSLTTKVFFQVKPDVIKLPGKWNAENSLYGLCVAYNDPSVNTNVYLAVRPASSSRGLEDRAADGKAYPSGACDKSLKNHCAITEYIALDMSVGMVLAHELGHNLGMPHDFTNGEDVPRLDSHGRSCLGQGGIMDYSSKIENDLSGWSTCSVEAFTAEMNRNKTCLRNVDPANPPPFPSKPAVTSQECDLSKNFPGINGVHYLWLNGYNVRLKCIEGVCSATNGCQTVCGQANCDNAVDPGTCDLSNQLSDFTGSQQISLNGLSSKKIVCKNGKCRPDKSAGYSDACEEICGFSSCLDAQPDPGVCDLTKFIGESASGRQKLCFNNISINAKCTNGLCTPWYAPYKNSCEAICGSTTCNNATKCTYKSRTN